ncbi:MAG: T9SS type A sorting domain-containing protein, partial [Flavobacteriales bacterium]|nr:T9SS type A sorting domain-containing protein [Flavobacteriales bacterium]
YFIDEDEWIDYTIRFQNTGTDTAFTVIISDTLPGTLDPGSIQWGATSHPYTRQLSGEGTLLFTFANIQLPDSNVNEAASHGFVSFRIKPFEPVLPGTTIENIANIYFDFNPPVITEPSVLVAEFSTGMPHEENGSLRVFPNPVSDLLNINAYHNMIVSIKVVTADGRTVLHRSVRSSRTSLDVSGLMPGLYHLIAILDTGAAVVEPFNLMKR